ncbi:MAG: hypothetical protein NTU63_01205 [Candidatus Pacearchaeota archaeon]|nr:hypothetical protein [Candidatus Pacearchaeota archaeon]
MKTCLYRFLGECKDCKPDYSSLHHPNNFDCPKHHEISFLEFNVVKVSLMEKVYIEIGEIFGKDGKLSKKILEQKVKELEKV